MYLLTKSETVASGVTVTFTGGSDTGNIIDADLETFSETAQRAPNLTVDLGSRKAIDSLFLKGENLQDYDLKASNNNISYTDIETGVTVPSHGNSFVTFTNTTAYRYWRLSFSQRGASAPNYRVAAVFLMRLLLDLNTDEKRPLHNRPSIPRTGVVAYETYNQNLVQYNTEGRGENHAHLSSGSIWTTMSPMRLKLCGKVPHTRLCSRFMPVPTPNLTRST